MANKNKNIQEDVYLTPLGTRVRFLRTGGILGWEVVRIKDGHRFFCHPKDLKLERSPGNAHRT